ncbi:UNKNOWN [Stylonychia lemnae]|uniref:Uncharacterized protein n=1 Tax=Stylonychia lemnae TaxID=5949 RepID=A0A077ZYL3_STYLE|nr:UNKNOWN [Stylonychia lemnae]|eukprot:CDW73621.1 UNKNOWN [Stylonychia lemnae]
MQNIIRQSIGGVKNILGNIVTFVTGNNDESNDQDSYASSCEEIDCKSDCSQCDSNNRSISMVSSKNSHTNHGLRNDDEDKENMPNQSTKRRKHNHNLKNDSQDCKHIFLSNDRQSNLSNLLRELNQSSDNQQTENILQEVTNQNKQIISSSKKRKFDMISSSNEQGKNKPQAYRIKPSGQPFNIYEKENEQLRFKAQPLQNLSTMNIFSQNSDQQVQQLQQNFENIWLTQSFDVQYMSDVKDKLKLKSLKIAFINKFDNLKKQKEGSMNQTIGSLNVQQSAFLKQKYDYQGSQNQIQVISLDEMQSSKMNIWKAYENIVEFYFVKSNQFYLEENSNIFNDSMMSSKDPDYFNFSQSINANKNYIECLLKSICQIHYSKQFYHKHDDEKVLIRNKNAGYQLTQSQLSRLLQNKKFDEGLYNAYMRLINFRTNLLGEKTIICLDTLQYSIIDNYLKKDQVHGKELKILQLLRAKVFNFLAVPIFNKASNSLIIFDTKIKEVFLLHDGGFSQEEISSIFGQIQRILILSGESSKWVENLYHFNQTQQIHQDYDPLLSLCITIENLALVSDVKNLLVLDFEFIEVTRRKVLIELIFGKILTQVN